MNVPSKTVGNWSWRLPAGALTAELAEKLAGLTEVSDRDECAQQVLLRAEQRDGKVGEQFAA